MAEKAPLLLPVDLIEQEEGREVEGKRAQWTERDLECECVGGGVGFGVEYPGQRKRESNSVNWEEGGGRGPWWANSSSENPNSKTRSRQIFKLKGSICHEVYLHMYISLYLLSLRTRKYEWKTVSLSTNRHIRKCININTLRS